MKVNMLFAVLGVVIFTTVMVFTSLYSHTIPEALQGRWVTDTPRYEACYLDLTADFVSIGTIQGDDQSGVVLNIRKDRNQKSSRYAITYLDDFGEESVLVLHYKPTEGGTVHLGNQTNVLWWRES